MKLIIQNLYFYNFRFIRKGTSGTYLEEMPPDLIKRIDDWSREELENVDFKFSI